MENLGKSLIENLFRNVLTASKVDNSVFERYIDPSYVQTVDGVTLDYAAFISHINYQKKVITTMKVEFVTIVQEDNVVFTNHIVTIQKKDGSSLKAHVIAQFTVKNNRLVACDELTRLIEGNQEDRDIGSRR